MLKKNLANMITCVRILGTTALLCLTPLSTPWLIVYAVCGLSDAADGIVARRLQISSKLGAKLDTVGDFCFYTVTISQLLPRYLTVLPEWIWYGMCVVLLIRALYYLYSFIRNHALAATHAILNKLTSFMIFLLPYAMNSNVFKGYCCVLLGVALSAAVQDWMQYLPEKWRFLLPGNKKNA